ncbi:MAG: LLM class flavin-dependent oxidoreductase [Proteobacteria bacterium]|jgi:alkanesulfonate monooxygenase SsuD/methylene tetrahydromethanopterin reductase-like flavin-dependent oxidoreductase (luciferase family)|nr:LLM class flavin-dependent oxidoreductase [Pseudomonadota bacterium]MDA1302234.1 LLM class flavin-dependent oxidoreductase [Pseudomonadota bacterium]
MEFGAQVGCYRNTWDNIRDVVNLLERGRWSSVWFADHYLPPPGRKEEEHLTAHEGYTVVAAVAAMTEKLRMGHLVLGNTYRNPALAAKMAATVDQISHGRFTFSVGAGWFKREHEAYGWEFPSMKERQDRLEEACQLVRQLFRSEAPVTFKGKYYSLDDAPLSPGSYGAPIPIMVGGTGEKRTLRTLARHGDVFNLDGWAGGPMTAEYLDYKWNILKRHCDDAGRDVSEIRKTILMPALLTDDKAAAEALMKGRGLGQGSAVGPKNYIIDRVGEIIDAGVDEIMFGGILTEHPEEFDRFDQEILSAFA